MSQTDAKKAAPAADPAPAGPEDPAASPESTLLTATVPQKPGEIGGPRGPEPTRYGDWESKGRCTDF